MLLKLPLTEIREIDLLDNDEVIVSWIGQERFKTKAVKREYEYEIFDEGSFRAKPAIETQVQRIINIDGSATTQLI